MDKEFIDFLEREVVLVLDELMESHSCSFPDDSEMEQRVAKIKQELEAFTK